MYLSNTYLEEGFPFHGRKQKQMEAFLKKSGLTPDSFYSYSVLLTDQNGSILGCGSRYATVIVVACIISDCKQISDVVLEEGITVERKLDAHSESSSRY